MSYAWVYLYRSYIVMDPPTCGACYLESFASQNFCTKREYCLCIQNPWTKFLPWVSTISTYMRYLPAVPSKFACATSNHSNKHLFCVPVPLMKRQGVVSVFHAKWVTLTMGVYSLVIARERLVIGMPSPMIKTKNNETNSPAKLIVWRAPEDSASHGLCLNGWGGVNFTFPLGNRL